MPEAIGVVPLEGRGSLPLLHLHREPLFLHAVRALLEVDALRRRVVVTVGDDHRAAVEAAMRDSRLTVPVQCVGDRGWPSVL
jgi:2-C-methyl-D-erythritol 4-phosphate cytidylyltransferase